MPLHTMRPFLRYKCVINSYCAVTGVKFNEGYEGDFVYDIIAKCIVPLVGWNTRILQSPAGKVPVKMQSK